MTEALDYIRLVAAAWRRAAIVEGTLGCALLIMTGLLADQGQAWRASASGVLAGGFLIAAGFTAVRALTWRREAEKREPITEGGM